MDGKIYRINEEVEVEEGNRKHLGTKIIKMVEEGIKTLRKENSKNCGGGNKKKLRREI